MITKIRIFLWKILGIDYNTILSKLDYTMLKQDRYAKIGKGTYDNGAKVWRWTKKKIEIGHYCSIANNVNFIVDEGFHTISTITNYPFINNKNYKSFDEIDINQKEGIIIGNDVWIGMGAFIMPGVKVGSGSIIAANSVVTKDVPDYAVVAGTPAKVIRMKYDEKTINALLRLQWWNWSEEIIQERKRDFYLPVEKFITKYEN